MNRPSAGSQLPEGVIAPYASLLLERRIGVARAGAPRGHGCGPRARREGLSAFYTANRARYTVPQRRVLLYAFVRPDQF